MIPFAVIVALKPKLGSLERFNAVFFSLEHLLKPRLAIIIMHFFCLLLVEKSFIDGGHIDDPSLGKKLVAFIYPETYFVSYWPQTLVGLFELTQHPLRALNLAFTGVSRWGQSGP